MGAKVKSLGCIVVLLFVIGCREPVSVHEESPREDQGTEITRVETLSLDETREMALFTRSSEAKSTQPAKVFHYKAPQAIVYSEKNESGTGYSVVLALGNVKDDQERGVSGTVDVAMYAQFASLPKAFEVDEVHVLEKVRVEFVSVPEFENVGDAMYDNPQRAILRSPSIGPTVVFQVGGEESMYDRMRNNYGTSSRVFLANGISFRKHTWTVAHGKLKADVSTNAGHVSPVKSKKEKGGGDVCNSADSTAVSDSLTGRSKGVGVIAKSVCTAGGVGSGKCSVDCGWAGGCGVSCNNGYYSCCSCNGLAPTCGCIKYTSGGGGGGGGGYELPKDLDDDTCDAGWTELCR